ncbi:hypothetical protein KSP39_PZI019214 [Platanthera zijinensis]|uniref:Uncharacterized protein n=1 Tax=Platanthera zijinensis TaxID=2320716 RepID=A0AAP0FXL6_9ASPA
MKGGWRGVCYYIYVYEKLERILKRRKKNLSARFAQAPAPIRPGRNPTPRNSPTCCYRRPFGPFLAAPATPTSSGVTPKKAARFSSSGVTPVNPWKCDSSTTILFFPPHLLSIF